MHQDYRDLYGPVSAARCQIVRTQRTDLNQNIRPRGERDGIEQTRSQWDYMIQVDGRDAGMIQVVELELGMAFVGWVHVQGWARGLGLGIALHQRVLDDYGTLAVEDFASSAELGLLATMARAGHPVTVRDGQSSLGITRHCKTVERMYVLHRLINN